MIEKQYFKENFYDEYAIKKKDTIIAIVDSGTNARKICDELNTLYNENEQLKLQLGHLEYRFFEYRNKIKSLSKNEVEKVLQKYYNQELGLFTHEILEEIANELGVDLE